MRDELLQIATGAVDAAKRAGASDAWASTTRKRDVSFEMRNGKLERVEDSTSRNLTIKLYVAGRYSAHSTTDLRPDRIAKFVADSVAITRALQPDPHRKLADKSRYPTALPDLQLGDPTVEKIDRDARVRWLQAMDERITGKPKVISASSYASDTTATHAAASSNGFRHAYATTSVGYHAAVTLEDGERRPEDYMAATARYLDGLPDPAGIADTALRLANARLGMAKGPTKRTTMIVDPRVAGSLVGRLLGPANGGSVQQQQSFWRTRLGKPAVAKLLTIVDDPLLPRGLGSRPFDNEGAAAKPLSLIRGGVFENLYVDTYYASKLGVAPTTSNSSNRVVALGKRDRDALIAAAKDAIYVTSWLGGNMDPTTGDFSLGVRGHLVAGGKLGAPVGEMNVTGNIVELFGHLVEVGNDPWKYASTITPTLVFEGVQFSGK